MKVLFVMRHPAAVRSLHSVLRLLDERGHRVHLAFGGIKPEAHKVLQALADECRGLTFGGLPARGSPGWSRDSIGWSRVSKRLRADADYLRYLEPSYADAPALRARAAANAQPAARGAASLARLAGTGGVRALRRSVEFVERCLEPPPHVSRFLVDSEPDVVVVTHLARDSVQVDYVRAAKRLGLHTAYPVFSWDNLTNKGLVHENPELVLVWNELQAAEAVELQGIAPEQVRVAGAWSYDHWFEWQPSRTRDELCAELGLRADRPLILYVCSSGFVARDEVAFVRRWIGELRRAGEPLAEAGVLVRPHPRNSAQWKGAQLGDGQATIWPRHGEEPLETVSRRNYFDSIYHAAAVVGINTSAQIEAAIVGRPVHTILADEFRETQQGTLHFQYLKADEFGHLYVGRTMAEHLEQLGESLRGRADEERNRRFLQRFVRPFGPEVAATPLYVEALEELAARPAPSPDPGPASGPVVRSALRPVAALAGRRSGGPRKRTDSEELDELRAAVRGLKRERTPVLALPWLGSELDELLYWVPFLRWAQTATFGLRDRLTVVCRRSSSGWYGGIGLRHLCLEDVVPHAEAPLTEQALVDALGGDAHEAALLRPRIVQERVDALAARGRDDQFHRRRLEFARLEVDRPTDRELPETYVTTNLAAARAVPELGPAVGLAGLDRPAQAAVISGSRGFVGTYGVEAIVAVLSGVPAVAARTPDVDERDLRVVDAYLSRPPFGDLHLVDADRDPAALARDAAEVLGKPADALAGV